LSRRLDRRCNEEDQETEGKGSGEEARLRGKACSKKLDNLDKGNKFKQLRIVREEGIKGG
jgi:hypothetical protein